MEINSNATAAETFTTLVYRKQHPGGGSLGRCSYGVAGVPGIVVFDMGLFSPETLASNGGMPPATLTINVAFSAPKVRKAANVTSAVVAAANTAQAAAKAEPIATPAQVANVAATVADAVVAGTAAMKHASTASKATEHGKGQRRSA